jgi:NAD(P)-dependent dehydrogenase (short-subunit alcohol dehydrogenase family)
LLTKRDDKFCNRFLTFLSQGIAPAFAKAGAKAIILVSRNEQKLNEVATTLNQTSTGLQVMVAPCNIADNEAVKNLFEKINNEFGHASILINNAGVMQAQGTVAEIEPQQWWEEVVSSPLANNAGGP